MMAIVERVIDNETEQTLDYEKDPRFVEYMKMRLERTTIAREAGRLIDAEDVFASIREKYGW